MMMRDGRTYRMLTDQVGSVRLVVDADSGAIMQQLDYDAWGNVIQVPIAAAEGLRSDGLLPRAEDLIGRDASCRAAMIHD